MTDFDALAAQLTAHPDFRVLRRLVPTDHCADAPANASVRHALLLDTETTGIDQHNDVIIELGLLRFTYDAHTGQILDVVAAESFLEDPGRPIPEVVVELTGITDDMVRGQRIPDARVHALLDGVGLVLAHNAGFDRPFVERRFPVFVNTHWGCTMRDIDWRGLGVGSHSLEFLVYRHLSAFFDGHRAVDDCRATLALLATPTAAGVLPMQVLLDTCRQTFVRICALGSPFDTKDVLKARGYRWNGADATPPKTWCRELPESAAEAEMAWLRTAVYADGRAQPVMEPVDRKRRWA